MEKQYTLKEIYKAFYKLFHKSGEWWFPYQDYTDQESEVNGAFIDFLVRLGFSYPNAEDIVEILIKES